MLYNALQEKPLAYEEKKMLLTEFHTISDVWLGAVHDKLEEK